MEAIGQLAAGIAHEINTPVQYIGDNSRFLQDAFADLERVIAAQRQFLEFAKAAGTPPPELAVAESAWESADADYLLAEIPRAVQQSLDGVERVTRIVQAMKEFSHPGGGQKTPTDLNRAIQSTVTVARNEWKYVSDLALDLDPDLPLVTCQRGEINQVVLNLVINAAHAIAEKLGATVDRMGEIRVRTRRDGEWVDIFISDTGNGIPEAIRGRVFEPFFTTKGVGKGTGQGLAIAHAVVVEKHGGVIDFETAPGQGTTFRVRLPIAGSPALPEEAAR
jgi:signal transduction histidine kinase